MNMPKDPPPFEVFAGRRELASYCDPILTMYRDNPLIEALPPILSPDEICRALASYPEYSDADRSYPGHLRLHMISNTLQFFAPMSIHIELEQRFSRMIRSGYLARNPLARNHWKELEGRVQATRQSSITKPVYRSTANGFTIIGISGGGKTTAAEETLDLYPQVIDHSLYRGIPFNRTQVVWLKLACPFDGSIKGLCLNFFQSLDHVLGTDYYHEYSSSRRKTVDELLPAMSRIASIHSIGVLVIDEIQHLCVSKSGGAEKMLNFFVQLINTIGLPVVLIGTYKAEPMLSAKFRQIRRGSGQGEMRWDRMRNDEEWRYFLKALWRYQYTQDVVPLTDDFNRTLYDESQGVLDFAVKMFMLAQVRAITTGKKCITPGIIRSVAVDSFKMAQPVLRALRTGDTMTLRSLNDVYPVEIDREIQREQRNVAADRVIASASPNGPHAARNRVQTETSSARPESSVKRSPKKPRRISKRAKRKKGTFPPDSLMEVVAHGEAEGLSPFDALKAKGFIKSAAEFLDDVA